MGDSLVNLVADITANTLVCHKVRNWTKLSTRHSNFTLLESTSSKNVVKFVYSAFGKLIELPLGTEFAFWLCHGRRQPCPYKMFYFDPRVVLYGLFKFAENAMITKSSRLLRS